MRSGLRQSVFILASLLLLANCASKPASCASDGGGFGGGLPRGNHELFGEETDGKGLREFAEDRIRQRRGGLPDDDGSSDTQHATGDGNPLQREGVNGGKGPVRPADRVAIQSFNLRAGTEFLSPLLTDIKHTAATISTDASNAAMEYQVQYMQGLKVPKIMRHSTPRQVIDNVLSVPAGTTTLIVGSHGSPGQSTFMRYWDDESIQAFGDAARAMGLKSIILTSCSSAAGSEGRQLIEKIAKASGADVYAWDIVLGSSPGYLSNYFNQNGNLVVAKPEWDKRETQYAEAHDVKLGRRSAEGSTDRYTHTSVTQ